ncbi:hypothetical protein GUITHDRAFT_135359 [Guillardia theta CCMP2712]|uniref:Sfi1 spindle body domain-containing protein n=1 Tax=Guillardia theta (strain CCMP2712) TaxID=905079 RepID=L1JNL8_GUITC|nr:hypothetical protein GUITHDRAFT_135359 [Guillardia theta CCMP2712]EKX50181.1 hypothetical protein GUITHDRAFT_135359 [Guillardia theta CCMP2712]|eukprot:XP_005837161.1 hypothetical protein GUITHDRAFT_135359 [Guillardia theta CCMP2712]
MQEEEWMLEGGRPQWRILLLPSDGREGAAARTTDELADSMCEQSGVKQRVNLYDHELVKCSVVHPHNQISEIPYVAAYRFSRPLYQMLRMSLHALRWAASRRKYGLRLSSRLTAKRRKFAMLAWSMSLAMRSRAREVKSMFAFLAVRIKLTGRMQSKDLLGWLDLASARSRDKDGTGRAVGQFQRQRHASVSQRLIVLLAHGRLNHLMACDWRLLYLMSLQDWWEKRRFSRWIKRESLKRMSMCFLLMKQDLMRNRWRRKLLSSKTRRARLNLCALVVEFWSARISHVSAVTRKLNRFCDQARSKVQRRVLYRWNEFSSSLTWRRWEKQHEKSLRKEERNVVLHWHLLARNRGEGRLLASRLLSRCAVDVAVRSLRVRLQAWRRRARVWISASKMREGGRAADGRRRLEEWRRGVRKKQWAEEGLAGLAGGLLEDAEGRERRKRRMRLEVVRRMQEGEGERAGERRRMRRMNKGLRGLEGHARKAMMAGDRLARLVRLLQQQKWRSKAIGLQLERKREEEQRRKKQTSMERWKRSMLFERLLRRNEEQAYYRSWRRSAQLSMQAWSESTRRRQAEKAAYWRVRERTEWRRKERAAGGWRGVAEEGRRVRGREERARGRREEQVARKSLNVWICTLRWFDWRRKVGANAIQRIGTMKRSERLRALLSSWRQLSSSPSSLSSLASSLQLREQRRMVWIALRRWKTEVFLSVRISTIMRILQNGHEAKMRIRILARSFKCWWENLLEARRISLTVHQLRILRQTIASPLDHRPMSLSAALPPSSQFSSPPRTANPMGGMRGEEDSLRTRMQQLLQASWAP